MYISLYYYVSTTLGYYVLMYAHWEKHGFDILTINYISNPA